MVLHGDKLGPAVLLGGSLHRGELVCPHGTGADVPHFTALDNVMQCLHRLLNRHSIVEAMDLQQINVVGL
jgi:hypothetical protein